MNNIHIIEEKGYYLKMSAVVLIEHVSVIELYGHTEFHVEGIVQDIGGTLLPLKIKHGAEDRELIAELRETLRQGNLLLVRDEGVHALSHTLRLLYPTFTVLEDDGDDIRKEFERGKALRDHPYDPMQGLPEGHIRGLAIECRMSSTREGDVFAFVTVDTEDGYYEAVLFPEIVQRYLEEISELGFMEFFGKIDSTGDPEEIPKIVVERLVKS